MKYSLADYILSVSIPSDLASQFGTETITVGGEGSYLDNIEISFNNNLWDTESDATGSWIHNKNLSRAGTATVTLNQVSNQVARFKTLCNLYYSNDFDGLTLTLQDRLGNEIATLEDCYINKIPNQNYQATAQPQPWVFTSGRITIK